jgi:hypothetical protein
VQYTSNYNYTVSSFYCVTSSGSLTQESFTPLSWIVPPSSSATTLTLIDATPFASFSVPFEVLIWDRVNVEKVHIPPALYIF